MKNLIHIVSEEKSHPFNYDVYFNPTDILSIEEKVFIKNKEYEWLTMVTLKNQDTNYAMKTIYLNGIRAAELKEKCEKFLKGE